MIFYWFGFLVLVCLLVSKVLFIIKVIVWLFFRVWKELLWFLVLMMCMFILFFLFNLLSNILEVVLEVMIIGFFVKFLKFLILEFFLVSRCVLIIKIVLENVVCCWCFRLLVVELYLKLKVLFCSNGIWFCEVMGISFIWRFGVLSFFLIVLMIRLE